MEPDSTTDIDTTTRSYSQYYQGKSNKYLLKGSLAKKVATMWCLVDVILNTICLIFVLYKAGVVVSDRTTEGFKNHTITEVWYCFKDPTALLGALFDTFAQVTYSVGSFYFFWTVWKGRRTESAVTVLYTSTAFFSLLISTIVRIVIAVRCDFHVGPVMLHVFGMLWCILGSYLEYSFIAWFVQQPIVRAGDPPESTLIYNATNPTIYKGVQSVNTVHHERQETKEGNKSVVFNNPLGFKNPGNARPGSASTTDHPPEYATMHGQAPRTSTPFHRNSRSSQRSISHGPPQRSSVASPAYSAPAHTQFSNKFSSSGNPSTFNFDAIFNQITHSNQPGHTERFQKK